MNDPIPNPNLQVEIHEDNRRQRQGHVQRGLQHVGIWVNPNRNRL